MARILLIDENIVTRSMARKTLLMAGHSVVDASSGADALDALGSASFDVVVMDAPLPDLPLADAIEQIRAAAGEPPVPLITMSDAELDTVALTALAGTPAARVPKPCTPHELTDAVTRLVSIAAAARDDHITLPETQREPRPS